MEAEFQGLKPWSVDSGIIECESTPLGFVDLHNCCDVRGLTLDTMRDSMTIHLVFTLIETGQSFSLTFSRVSQIQVAPSEFPVGDGQLINGIDYYDTGSSEPPMFEIDLDPIGIKFRATGVAFVVE